MKSYQFKPPYLKGIITDRLRVWRKSKLYKLYKKYPSHSLIIIATILAVLFLSIVRVYAMPEPVIEVGIPIPKYERLEPIKAPKTKKVEYATVKVEKPSVAPTVRQDGTLNWMALRICESGNNYQNKSNPTYRGAYQFDQPTWDAYTLDGYVGVDPADAPPGVQDSTAQRLYDARGSQPWPVCGQRLYT